MQRKRAFTLIELLVVIAIIAILAAILFPVFAKARERAKASSSLNNMKQLALGVLTYAQDHGETFPGWVQTNAAGTTFTNNVWDEQIAPNIKSNAVFNNKDSGYKSPSDPRRERVLTYGINGWLLASTTTGSIRSAFTSHTSGSPAPAPMTTSTVGDPAGTILLAELSTETAVKNGGSTNFTLNLPNTGGTDQWNAALGHWIDISPREWVENGQTAANAYDPNLWDPTNGVARDFYGGGGNYAFVDGHVQFMKIGNTVGLGKTYVLANGSQSPVITPGAQAWNLLNTYNLWNPNK